MDTIKDFLKTVIEQAGRISLDFRDRLSSLEINRKSEKDMVTEADVAVERYLVEQIRRAYPDHTILGEESGAHDGNEYRWVIDPIDGTTSFIHQLPFYSVSVALQKDGEPILAAVNVPVLGELFMAEKGKGAELNGRPIHVSARTELSECILGTGFACLRENLKNNNLPYFNRLAPLIRGVRRHGSAAADLAYVACGRFDGFWELNLKIYDIAAGALILTEAGGKITDFSGKNADFPFETLATNGVLHPQLIKMFAEIKQHSPQEST